MKKNTCRSENRPIINRPGVMSYNEYELPLTFEPGSGPAFLIFG